MYVDDIVITGGNTNSISSTISYLTANFDIKDLGPLKFFLGIEVHRTCSSIFLTQKKYALDLLECTHILGAKLVTTPAVFG